ncbi:MAG: ROK family protein [Reyranella sp.]|uniref:ROK family protein n=1 Tax=Reyranella sp. TaxID=1929291 RepID=UPI00120E2AD0|nr:ROK family protein [Reyranella sp.]TAJ87719.1 MAG: ROK family protein [Reyranella sp.]
MAARTGIETGASAEVPVEAPSVFVHGGRVLPSVTVDTYNEELRDEEGFVGDRASRRAFQAILADWRDRLKERGEDPFGDVPMEEISKSKLDKMLNGGDPVSAGLVHTVVEEFAGELATVVRRFLRLGSWKDTERIVIGGGMIGSRIGELAMGRASIILAAESVTIELQAIENDPDEAGLIGAVHLAPSWVMAGHDAILAVDIGGTNVRVGVVELNAGKRGEVGEADVWKRQVWRHADDEPDRDEAIERIAAMLNKLIDRAKQEKIKLAPFMGIGCPGLIDEHGFILKGGQNLPGNWEGKSFNLAAALSAHLPKIDGHEIFIQIHNDAVVQGLSEVPNMKDVEHWGVMTIGTGLGNARFTNRE